MVYQSPIFVVGSPRSGTTLLQCMLSANKETFSLPETHYFCSVLPRLELKPQDQMDIDRLEVVMTAFRKVLHFDLPTSLDLRFIDRHSRNGLSALDIFSGVVELYRPGHDGNKSLRLIEKTPMHVFFMRDIIKSFPSARFVNVVRNPCDVVSSLILRSKEYTQSVLRFASSWNACIDAAGRFEADFPEKILSIRYEDLVTETHGTLLEICEFLDLEFDSSMVCDFGGQHSMVVLPHEIGKENVRTGQICNKSGAWRNRITRGQAWLVEEECQAMMSVCGYRGDSDPSLEEKAAAVERESAVFHEELKDQKTLDLWLMTLEKICQSSDLGFPSAKEMSTRRS